MADAVSQSFLSVFPYLLVELMDTGQKCRHLPGEMLNLTAKASRKARIVIQRQWSQQNIFGRNCQRNIRPTTASAKRADNDKNLIS
jgi:hypothetical protein